MPNQIPLDQGVATPNVSQASDLQLAWRKMKTGMFADKTTKPDSVNADTRNHLGWYKATGFKTPYPGEKTVLWPVYFRDRLSLPSPKSDLDE